MLPAGTVNLDNDSTNELQSLSFSNDTLYLTNGNYVIIPDNVIDADADSTNELQILAINGDTLSISNGNNVTLSLGGGIPSGAVMYFNLATCPTGWSELTAARGRYLVGRTLGGTLAGTQGTAMFDLENRETGTHTHNITDPGHVHTARANAGTGGTYILIGSPGSGQRSGLIPSNTTGISIQNAGSVPGTNAPYIQLVVCQKD